MWDGVDRRQFARAEYPCLITVRSKAPLREAILTHTRNISIGGIRVVINKKMEILTEVVLALDLKDTLPTISAEGVISWVQEAPAQKGKASRYDTGIQFTSLSDGARRRIEKIVNHLLGKKS